MKNKGFTLIELVIAVFLIALGVVGAFGVLQKIIISTSLSSSRLVASYLAQEGIEIVRNIRDTNWIEGTSWNDGLIPCFSGGDCCEGDYDDQALTSYQDRYLKINGKFYNYDSGTETKFKRVICIDPDGVLEVRVQVEWEEHGGTHTVTVQENLYNWFRIE